MVKYLPEFVGNTVQRQVVASFLVYLVLLLWMQSPCRKVWTVEVQSPYKELTVGEVWLACKG